MCSYFTISVAENTWWCGWRLRLKLLYIFFYSKQQTASLFWPTPCPAAGMKALVPFECRMLLQPPFVSEKTPNFILILFDQPQKDTLRPIEIAAKSYCCCAVLLFCITWFPFKSGVASSGSSSLCCCCVGCCCHLVGSARLNLECGNCVSKALSRPIIRSAISINHHKYCNDLQVTTLNIYLISRRV